MSLLSREPRFSRDDGSADPVAAAALAAYAAGTGSEHAALSALARSRLLVPVVAGVTQRDRSGGASQGDEAGQGDGAGEAGQGSGTGQAAGAGPEAEKSSEMALPSLIGQDGRAAIPVFTCIGAMTGWRPDARPVPTAAERVWQAAVTAESAVVIDVAGPVPLIIEGARLAALAAGDAVPQPADDPDIAAAVTAAIAAVVPAARFRLAGGLQDADLSLELELPHAAPGQADAMIAEIGPAVAAAVGARLRRGIAVLVGQPQQPGS